jgi:multidrug efflux pump subunit AcrA (membrane-fusion protein)
MRPFPPLWTCLAAALILAGCAQPVAGPLTASGTVEATEVVIGPEIAGKVLEVSVDEGDTVRAGQTLVKLDGALLTAQLRQAETAVAAAQANYDLLAAGPTDEQLRQAGAAVIVARTAYSRTIEGTRQADIDAAQSAVNAAYANYHKVKAGPEKEDYAAAEAALRTAEAALRQAQGFYDQAYARSPATISASREALALEKATNDYHAALAVFDALSKPADAARLAAAYQQIQAAKAGLDRLVTPAQAYDIEQAQAHIEAAQARLDELRAGARPQQLAAARTQVDAAQAAMEVLRAQQDKLTLAAPVDAVVLSRAIQPGETALPGTPLLVLARLDDLSVTVYVPEDRYGQIALGQAAQVQSDSFPGAAFTATVDHIAGRAEFTPRNVQTAEGRASTVFAVRLKVRDPDGRLKPGMPVDVVFTD